MWGGTIMYNELEEMTEEAVSYVALSWLAWSEKKIAKNPSEQPMFAILTSANCHLFSELLAKFLSAWQLRLSSAPH
jgi:hypothetical protein